MSDHTLPLPDLLTRVREHVMKARLKQRSLQGLFWGLVVGVPALASQRLIGWEPGWIVGLLSPLAGAAGGAAVAFLSVPRPERMARFLDRLLAAQDQIVTAWEVARQTPGNPLEAQLLETIAKQIAETPLTRIQRDELPPETKPALVLTAFLGGLLLFPLIAEFFLPPPAGLVEMRPEIEVLEKKLEELKKRIPEKPKDLEAKKKEPEAIRKRREYQEEAEERVRKLLVKMRWAKKSGAAKAYAKEAEQVLADEATTNNDPVDPKLEEFKDALRKGDLARAQKLAKQLGEEIQKKAGSSEKAQKEMQKLAEKLRQAAREIQDEKAGPQKWAKAKVDGGTPSDQNGKPGSESCDNPGSNPGGSQPGGSQPGGSQPGGSQPGGSQPGGSQPGGSQPGGGQPGGGQPGGGRPGGSGESGSKGPGMNGEGGKAGGAGGQSGAGKGGGKTPNGLGEHAGGKNDSGGKTGDGGGKGGGGAGLGKSSGGKNPDGSDAGGDRKADPDGKGGPGSAKGGAAGVDTGAAGDPQGPKGDNSAGKGSGGKDGGSEAADRAEMAKTLERAAQRLAAGDAEGAKREIDQLEKKLASITGQGDKSGTATGGNPNKVGDGGGDSKGSAGGAGGGGGEAGTQGGGKSDRPGNARPTGSTKAVRGRVQQGQGLKTIKGKAKGKGASRAFAKGDGKSTPEAVKAAKEEEQARAHEFQETMHEYLNQENVPGEYRSLIKDYFSQDEEAR